jgi:hypothetical protein
LRDLEYKVLEVLEPGKVGKARRMISFNKSFLRMVTTTLRANKRPQQEQIQD